jgi:peroxiredoxin
VNVAALLLAAAAIVGAGGRPAALSFHLQDTTGVWHDAAEWRGAKAVVLAFISIDCPISNSYAPELQRVRADYEKRGVEFYAVQPEADRALEDVQKYVADFSYTFPLLLDLHQVLTRIAKATMMPQVVVLSPHGDILYSGRIDDRYIAIGNVRYAATRNDLREALDAVLAGKPVPNPKTQAVGCVIP